MRKWMWSLSDSNMSTAKSAFFRNTPQYALSFTVEFSNKELLSALDTENQMTL